MSVQFNPTPSSVSMEASQAPVETRPPASLGNGEGTSTLQSMAPAKASSCCLWEMFSSLWNWLKGLFCFSATTEIQGNCQNLPQESQLMQDFAEIQSKDSLFLEINERRAKLRHAPEIVENEWWKKMEIDCTNTYKKNAFPLRFKLPPHDFKEKYYAEFFCFLSPYINSADKKKFINRFMLIRGQYDMEDRWRRISQGIIAPNTHDPLLIEKNPFIYGEDIHSFVCDFMTQISMTGYSSPTIIDRKACPTFLSQINPHFPKK